MARTPVSLSVLATICLLSPLVAASAHGDPGGRVSTLAQVPGGTGGLVVDSKGTLFSAEFGDLLGDRENPGTRLFRVTADGEVEVFAKGFEGASGVAINGEGEMFQANIRGGYISRVAESGEISEFARDGLRGPVGIVIDDMGTLWVANCGGNSIQKVLRDGTSTRFLDSPLLKCPNGITLDDDHNLYVANFFSGDVVKITPKGEASVLATLPGENNGHITYADGALYVVARSAHQIYTVSLDGTVTLFAGTGEKGGDDGPRLEASFCYPNDIAVSPDGKLVYVNEVADHSSEGMKLAPTRIRAIER